MGWIILGVVYVLGAVIVYRGANDPTHRLMAAIWPITILFLLLTMPRGEH
jgi:hypothetical protein